MPWGHDQLVAYRDKLDGALQAIARNPALGHRRDDLPATYRAYLVGSHVIVYRVEADSVGMVAHPAPADEFAEACIAAAPGVGGRHGPTCASIFDKLGELIAGKAYLDPEISRGLA